MATKAQTKTAPARTGRAAPKAVTAKNAAKAIAAAKPVRNPKAPVAVQAPKGSVPGMAHVQRVTGKGTSGRTIAALLSANNGNDTLALMNDGSARPVTKLFVAGVPCKVGLDYDACMAAFEAVQAAEAKAKAAAKRGQPKGRAVLAKGAESERECRIAAAASKAAPKGPAKAAAKPAQAAKAPAKGSTPKAAPKAPVAPAKPARAGTGRAYVKGPKADTSKPDTFRRYMLSTILAHKNTEAAKAAHAAGGQYPTHKLDFNWSAKQGYIAFKS